MKRFLLKYIEYNAVVRLFITALLLILFFGNANGQEPRLIVPISHPEGVLDAIFSPDGNYVVTNSYNDLNARLWNAKTGELLNSFTMQNMIWHSLFSPDGRSLLTSSQNRAVLWDIKTGLKKCEFETDGKNIDLHNRDNKDSFHGLLFAGKKNDLVTGQYNYIRVYDSKTGKKKKEIKFNSVIFNINKANNNFVMVTTKNNDTSFCITAVDIYSGKKDLLLTGKQCYPFSYKDYFMITEKNGLVHVFNNHTCEAVNTFKIVGASNCVALSEDGNTLLTSTSDSLITAYNTKTGSIISSHKVNQLLTNIEFVDNGGAFIAYTKHNFAFLAETGTCKFIYAFEKDNNSFLERNVNAFINFSRDRKHVLMVFEDNAVRMWNLSQPIPVLEQSFAGKTSAINCRAISNNSVYCAVGNAIGQVNVFNLKDGSSRLFLQADSNEMDNIVFTSDSKYIVTASGNKCKLWEFPSGKLVHTWFNLGDGVSVDVSTDNKYLLTNAPKYKSQFNPQLGDTTVRIWDLKTYSLLKTIIVNDSIGFMDAKFANNNKDIITAKSQDSTINIRNIETGKISQVFKLTKTEYLYHVNENQQSGRIVATSDHAASVFDKATGKLINSFPANDISGTGGSDLSNDGKYLLAGNADGSMQKWDVSNHKLLQNVNVHYASFYPTAAANDSLVITASEDGTVKGFDFNTLKERYMIVPFNSGDYIVRVSSGYYKCTPNAARILHYVDKNLDVITFEQLDIKYNRPDKVLQAIGCTDTALINAYHRAYIKRITRLKIDTTQFKSGFSVPKADFLGRDNISTVQNKETMTLHIMGADSTYNLDRFNVWVNGVPLYSVNGVNLNRNPRKMLDTVVNVTLSNGRNRIETSVTNINGSESYHIPLYVNYKSGNAVDTGKFYFIGIGIDHFAQNGHNLNWSVKDIRNLATAFKNKYGATCEIGTLFDKDVTIDKVAALRQMLMHTGINDKVIVAYSGHGLLSKDYDYYLSTYNVDFDKPEKYGLPYEKLEGLLEDIPARKKLMLIDACHSGEVDKDDMKASQASNNLVVHTGRIGQITKGKPALSMSGSFELMQHLFTDVGKNSGATVISAASGKQLAIERGDLNDGVFTYSILTYMQQQPHCSISALKTYVNNQVTLLTDGAQHPTTRTENNAVDWQIW